MIDSDYSGLTDDQPGVKVSITCPDGMKQEATFSNVSSCVGGDDVSSSLVPCTLRITRTRLALSRCSFVVRGNRLAHFLIINTDALDTQLSYEDVDFTVWSSTYRYSNI